MIGGLSFQHSTPVGHYAARRSNLHNSAGYYYTRKYDISDVVTLTEL
jgi:hypothetical protein